MAGTESKLDCLIRSADAVVGAHAGFRTNGNVASIRTQKYSLEFIRETCRRLHKLGYYLEDIDGLREKHIEVVIRDWYAQGLSNKTLQNQFSRLKIFCGWLGRPGIVKSNGMGVSQYLPEIRPEALKVKTYTETSKSWSGNGVNIVEVIQRATQEDRRLGAMLTLGVAFGLRKKEMLRIKPWRADKGTHLEIDGSVAKNGKYRAIPLQLNDYGKFQRWALDLAKSLCKKTETLGWPDLSFKQAENRYYHHLRRLGITKVDSQVTGHGLRAEFAENMALWRGLVPPSLGGTANQLPSAQLMAIKTEVSNFLGHDDTHTIHAYFSSFRKVASVGGIGGRIGTVVLDAEQDSVALIYCNPAPVRAPDGNYRVQTEEERQQTIVTAAIDSPGKDPIHLDIASLVSTYPATSDRIRRLLIINGLGGTEQY